MNFPKKFLDIAKEEAVKSNHYHKIGAVIFKNKSIISTGYNYPRRSTKHLLPKFQKWQYSLHAEICAILKARCDLSDCSILVVRVNKKGKLMMAKPCKFCSEYIDYVGLENVYYSNKEGEIICLKKNL